MVVVIFYLLSANVTYIECVSKMKRVTTNRRILNKDILQDAVYLQTRHCSNDRFLQIVVVVDDEIPESRRRHQCPIHESYLLFILRTECMSFVQSILSLIFVSWLPARSRRSAKENDCTCVDSILWVFFSNPRKANLLDYINCRFYCTLQSFYHFDYLIPIDTTHSQIRIRYRSFSRFALACWWVCCIFSESFDFRVSVSNFVIRDVNTA